MLKHPASEASSFPVVPEIHCLLWTRKVHYHIHKSPPMAPITSHINHVRVMAREYFFHNRLCMPISFTVHSSKYLLHTVRYSKFTVNNIQRISVYVPRVFIHMYLSKIQLHTAVLLFPPLPFFLSSPLAPPFRDTVVCIATGYGLDDRGVGVGVPVRSTIFSSSRCPDRLWGPPSLSNGYRE
jgi:hypothetical protein